MYKSNKSYDRVSDADFQMVMEDCGFGGTPRETLTVGDMVKHLLKNETLHKEGKFEYTK